MDTIRYLLGFVFKLAIALLIGALALWLVNLLYPNLKISNILSGKIFSADWLPAPKNYGGLLGGQNEEVYGTVYQHGTTFNGYGNNQTQYGTYVAYSNTNGTQGATGVFSGNTQTQADRSLYVRNLSLYEGGAISYGTTIHGEAKSTMFRNGIFPVVILDARGNVIASGPAINTGTWAAPGWVRFQTTISSKLPSNTPCQLVFLSAQDSTQIRINVRCN